MGIISLEKSSCLFWLGRYTERAFTMLEAGLEVYDQYIDGRIEARKDFLDKLCICDKWGEMKASECFHDMVFDINNTGSVRYCLERAYDNGIVLRDEISTEALAQLQLELDTADKSSLSENSASYSLIALKDRIFAFEGCINNCIYNKEVLNLILCGKYLERLDMYIRLEYPPADLKKEFDRLCDVLRNFPKDTPYRYNTKYLSVLVESLDLGLDYLERRDECLESLGRLFEKLL